MMHSHDTPDDHHDHHVEATAQADAPPGYYEIMETAVRELLIEKKLFGAGEIRRQIEVLDSRTPALGAKVVARAWVDPDFRARLLANGRTACEEGFGISFYDDTELIVLENTETIHNLIVCTLCSCYPRPVLGLPPDWYNKNPTAPAPSRNRARFWRSSAPSFPTTWRSGSAIPRRSCVTSCCRGVRRARQISARSSWPRSSPATR